MNVEGCAVKDMMEAEMARLSRVLQQEMVARKNAVEPPKQTREQKLAQLKDRWTPLHHDYVCGG